MVRVSATTNKEQMIRVIADIEEAIWDGTREGMGRLALKTVVEYKKNIDEGLRKYGTGHTRKRESITDKAIGIQYLERIRGGLTIDVLQKSVAGRMMEIDKTVRQLGAMYGGQPIIPTNSARGRRWLREKKYMRDGKPMIIKRRTTGQTTATGRNPFKPMTQTFEEYTSSEDGIMVIAEELKEKLERI